MKKATTILLIMSIFALSFANPMPEKRYIDDYLIEKTVNKLSSKTNVSSAVLERGIKQAAALWLPSDGTHADFLKFCEKHIAKSKDEKEQLFNRLCENFETILGNNNNTSILLQLPIHVANMPRTAIDQYFAAYDGLAHLNEDMFNSKIAFIVILNFPHYSLQEKKNNGENWTNLEWGYVRLGDMFTSRVPAEKQQAVNLAIVKAEDYINNYYIHMEKVWSDNNDVFWKYGTNLIMHWGLRDELKAASSDQKNGRTKQKIIYNIMKRIVDQSIPEDVINKSEYIWYPSTNQVFYNVIEIECAPEKNIRYKHLLNVFKAIKATDEFYEGNTTYIDRKFNEELEISLKETEKLFTQLMTSEQVEEVAKFISKRLGRKLEPFDIWYDGFKSRNTMDQNRLNEVVQKKYPNKEAFEKDIPNILTDLGFTPEKANFISDHLIVDASSGAGHAWAAESKNDKARLRTRVEEDGMNYKGYNIGIHELGHNVEQTISLHDVDNYFLKGVPNTSFSEALAFAFQGRDLQLLKVDEANEMEDYLKTLDLFWTTYEMMGVSLVDIKVWQWMYQNPNATAADLKNAVVAIAKDIWNQYYAPVFKVKDQVILASYSHLILYPLYLSAYPIGHVIDFQLEEYLKGKNLGTEVERIFKIGKKTPNVWMKEAIGEEISVNPLLTAVSLAIPKIVEHDKAKAKTSKK